MKTTTHTTNPPSFFLCIDVVKKDLFCHIIAPGGPCSARFDNIPSGITLLLKWDLKLLRLLHPEKFAIANSE